MFVPSHNRAPRMSRKLSQAPRLSVVIMAGDETQERKHDSVRGFCANHVKTIVTLVMIFGTILCIVLIVMVHKWRYENEKAIEIKACLDVAVIGAGISGSYATWRMRHDTKSKIHLFEISDQAGGRFMTKRFDDLEDYDNIVAELGAMSYVPQRQPLLNRTIHALKLTPKEFSPPNRDPPTCYFRDQHLKKTRIKSYNPQTQLPYHLQPQERNMLPQELKRYYTERHLSNIHIDPLSAKYKGYVPLYDMGYWSFLNSVASREGLNFLYDGMPWRSHVSNGNAALLASLDMDTWDKHYTLQGGMDSLPKALVSQFLNTSKNHEVHYNRRLVCVQNQHGYFTLIFQKTVTRNGVTKNLTESEVLCTRKLILALPPAVLKNVRFTGFEKSENEVVAMPSDLVDSYLEPVPVMTAYLLFNSSWWQGNPNNQPLSDVITDLPIRRMRYVGSSPMKSKSVEEDGSMTSKSLEESGHLFMVANSDLEDAKYFEPLTRAAQYNSVIKSDCNLTVQSLQDLKMQIAKVQNVSSIPDPVDAVMKDWGGEPFGAGWHMWKIGVQFNKTSSRLQVPFPDEKLFLVGSDLCPGSCQFSAEGGLSTVERLLEDYFPKAFWSPIEDSQPNSVFGDEIQPDITHEYSYAHQNL